MYWPYSTPASLATEAGDDGQGAEQVVFDRSGERMLVLGPDRLALYRTKPPVVLGVVKRTDAGLARDGRFERAAFGWDGLSLFVVTAKHVLLHYVLLLTPQRPVYEPPPPTSAAQARKLAETFAPGPGEGTELEGCEMQFQGATVIPGLESFAVRPDGLTLLLLFPHPALLDLPYPPFPADLPDPAKLPIVPERLALDPAADGRLSLAGRGGHVSEEVGDECGDGSRSERGELVGSRALGVYALVLPGGACFVLSRPPEVAALSSVSLSAGSSGGVGTSSGSAAASAADKMGDLGPMMAGLPGPVDSDRQPGRSPDKSHPTARRPGAAGSPASGWHVREVEIRETPPTRAAPAVNSKSNGKRPPARERARAVRASLNGRLGLLAIGSTSGAVHLYSLPTLEPHLPSPLILSRAAQNHRLKTGRVRSLAWTPDGCALAVGWSNGWSLWSSSGRLLGSAVRERDDGPAATGGLEAAGEDWFHKGVCDLGWIGGGLELVLLARSTGRLFIQPVAKSSFTTLPTPSATLYPLLLTPGALLLSPVASLPSSTYLSTLHSLPSSFVTVPLPAAYNPYQYPIRYATVSDDGRLVAVAGTRGFATWSRTSGRWKVFEREEEEEAFRVRGGMCWFLHVLVVGVEEAGRHYLRLYSRDDDLTATSHLSSVPLPAPIQLLSLHDNSLLLYTTANNFYHFLIVPTADAVELRLCGSISFEGVVDVPGRVRAMSWLIPLAQKKLGNPADDLPLATVIFLIDASLVLLRPRKASSAHLSHRRSASMHPSSPSSPANADGQQYRRTPSRALAEPEEVRYDLQVLADRVESYWTHLTGIGTLENSLWAWDGERLRVWLDALTVDRVESAGREVQPGSGVSGGGYKRVGESVSIPLDFYPLSVLMDKGIITGVESELSVRRAIPFGTFKLLTSTHLFLPHLLRFHLARGQIRAAVGFAAHFTELSYFAHALEILLHGVLEQEADEGPAPSPLVVDGIEWTRPLSDLSPMTPTFTTDVGLPSTSDALNEDDEPRSAVDKRPPAPTEHWRGVGVLPLVVEFLDHFPEALAVVVGCARKTELSRWDFLFDVVGNPRDLFEACLQSGRLKTATSYLLVLHTLERLSSPSTDTLRVLRRAIDAGEWDLCKDLLRFLHSVDGDGRELTAVVRELGVFGQADLAHLVMGTTADDSPFVEDEDPPAATSAEPSERSQTSPSSSPSPARPAAMTTTGKASQQPLSPIVDSPRPAISSSTTSSASLTGLSSLLFGASLGSPPPPTTTPTGGRVFSRPVGPAEQPSPSPSPARPSSKPREGGGRWI